VSPADFLGAFLFNIEILDGLRLELELVGLTLFFWIAHGLLPSSE